MTQDDSLLPRCAVLEEQELGQRSWFWSCRPAGKGPRRGVSGAGGPQSPLRLRGARSGAGLAPQAQAADHFHSWFAMESSRQRFASSKRALRGQRQSLHMGIKFR